MPATFSGKMQSRLDELFGAPQPLFSKEDFEDAMTTRGAEILIEIQGYPVNELLNIGIERLIGYFESKFHIEIPALDREGRTISHREIYAEVQHDDSSKKPELAPGFRYRIKVPFVGDPRIFNSRPPIKDTIELPKPPLVVIDSDALVFTYDQIDVDEDKLKASHGRELEIVEQYLAWLAEEFHVFKEAIRDSAAQEIQARRTRLLKAHGVAASLGIRLERASLPTTYSVPRIQRKPRIVRPNVSTDPYAPEPTLEIAEYEHILDVIRGTTLVIERNPSTFAAASEPLIRDHFLVQLNGHYKGQATGETFNSCGKSDILVREGDKNIFIAELKFWDGPRSATNALRQLLTKYTTWRDSKIALVILNRRRNFSAVLDQIPGAIEAYEHTIRPVQISSNTDFRYLLRHPSDPNKELILTVMCFEVPEKIRKSD